jgi:hypothetical protein
MSPWNRDIDPKTPATEPPVLTYGQDLYVWRKAVSEWIDLVDTAAREPNDRQFKTIRATLGRQLYRALPTSHRGVVDEAQARDLVSYRQENQLRAVDELVGLIATDPPSLLSPDSSTRLARSTDVSANSMKLSMHSSLASGGLPLITQCVPGLRARARQLRCLPSSSSTMLHFRMRPSLLLSLNRFALLSQGNPMSTRTVLLSERTSKCSRITSLMPTSRSYPCTTTPSNLWVLLLLPRIYVRCMTVSQKFKFSE